MIYLASQSPRRRELLTQIGVEFEVLPVNVDESVSSGEQAEPYVLRMAELKAKTCAQLVDKPWPVLASDTIVICDGRILLKPKDKLDALETLALLSGRSHQVKTAIAVIHKDVLKSEVVTTEVTFRAMSATEIEDYWHTGEPCDKAGSYGIQGIAGKFVKAINGSYSSVVGLPLMETEQLLQQFTQDLKA